jgi:AraC-like DNA-binding protein
MVVATVLHQGHGFAVHDYRCTSGPGDASFVEVHPNHSLSLVLEGSFACTMEGRGHDLVAGALMVGRPGAEYVCTHDHVHGDHCLSVQMEPDFAESFGAGKGIWETGCVAPLAETMVAGALASAAARGEAEIGLDEAAVLLVEAFVRLAGNGARRERAPGVRERARMVDAALWIDENADEEIDLEGLAARAGLSAFHFLRLFRRVTGATPHQYLVRRRLARAAAMLAEETSPVTDVAYACGFGDLSNFVRTFHRAAGLSPGAFRKAAAGERKILQARLARGA